MLLRSDPALHVHQQIVALRDRLEAPIHKRHDIYFHILIGALVERALKQNNFAELERLAWHKEAIEQQWIPLAVRDDLLPAWKAALADDEVKFLRRYNLFVTRGIHEFAPERWTQLWRHWSKLSILHQRLMNWGDVMKETVTPVVDRARKTIPERDSSDLWTIRRFA